MLPFIRTQQIMYSHSTVHSSIVDIVPVDGGIPPVLSAVKATVKSLDAGKFHG